jgi:lysophospholipase L1-like esterase
VTFEHKLRAAVLVIGAAVGLLGGPARAEHESWLVPPASAVSLGDSYAALQTEALRDQLGVEVLNLARGGSFAAWWLGRAWDWAWLVRELPGPVLVVLTAGTNDERSDTLGSPPDVVAERVAALASLLLDQRPDLQVIVTGYNGTCADVEFPAYLPLDTDRYRYIETRQLDARLKFVDSCHLDEHGYAKRVRYVLRESRWW